MMQINAERESDDVRYAADHRDEALCCMASSMDHGTIPYSSSASTCTDDIKPATGEAQHPRLSKESPMHGQ
jgi:hypothetical protein